jgi:Transcription factor WhiB
MLTLNCSSRSPRRVPSLDQVTQAKAICAGRPVRRHCPAFALDTRQDHGVWGGTTEHERRPRATKHLPGPDTPRPAVTRTALPAASHTASKPSATASSNRLASSRGRTGNARRFQYRTRINCSAEGQTDDFKSPTRTADISHRYARTRSLSVMIFPVRPRAQLAGFAGCRGIRLIT